MTQPKQFDLDEIAYEAASEHGFIPDFPPAVIHELTAISAPIIPRPTPSLRDTRDRLWISIDNDDTKDLDQLTFAEALSDDRYLISVAIADVDGLVPQGFAIDTYAASNTTSIYTPTKIFPMLPLKLSTNFTSLNENADRSAIVVEMEISKEGQFDLRTIYPAWVRNHAKLAYNQTTEWLNKKSSSPRPNTPGLLDQLGLQDKIARLIKQYRYREGALSFGLVEAEPVIVDGIAINLKTRVHNRAHVLIENFMIAANVVVTRYLIQHQIPTLRRIVKTPKRWDRIIALAKELGEQLPPEPDPKALQSFLLKQRQFNPVQFPDLSLSVIKLIGNGEYIVGIPGESVPGHFDLAVSEYSHATAPNRRFSDLIMQRLLKTCFYNNSIPYSNKDLTGIATRCTQMEDEANKVERHVRKSAVAMILSNRLGEQFSAIVTGAADKGTWVRLLDLPLEGKLIQGFQGLDIGDRLNVKLVHVDIPKGHIDFVRI